MNSEGFVILSMEEARGILMLLRHINTIGKTIDVAESIQLDFAEDVLKINGCYLKEDLS